MKTDFPPVHPVRLVCPKGGDCYTPRELLILDFFLPGLVVIQCSVDVVAGNLGVGV